MESEIPRWADAELSKQMPHILEVGESNRVEFKELFPEQGHKLTKELAALGTSGGGTLFVGISDNCEAIGLPIGDGDARDDLRERALGIARAVKPQLNVEIKLAVVDGNTVLAIVVAPDQVEPVFYYEGKPYIRDECRSRPAEPHEVKEKVWSHPSSEHRRALEQLEFERENIKVNQQRVQAEAWNSLFRRSGRIGTS